MMTNSCYCPRGVFDMYRGGDPTKRFAGCRKMSKIYRLSLKVTVPLANFVLPKIYKMESVMESFQGKLYMMAFQRKIHMMEYPEHRITYRSMHFVHRSVKVFLKLEAPIRVAITALYVTALYCCALIAILN